MHRCSAARLSFRPLYTQIPQFKEGPWVMVGGTGKLQGIRGMVFPGGRNTVCLMLSVEHREGVTAVSKETQV